MKGGQGGNFLELVRPESFGSHVSDTQERGLVYIQALNLTQTLYIV